MVPTIGGLVWCSAWSVPGEGPYTLLAKLIGANGPSTTRRLKNTLRWKQPNGTSLLSPRLIDSAKEPALALGRFLCDASIGAHFPRVYKDLAGDRVLRYCRACMAFGFQAAVAQIDGLDFCPIHGEPYRTSCDRCGAKTPAYVLRDGDWLPGFSCKHCGSPFGGDKAIDHRPEAWIPPVKANCLDPIQNWLKKVGDSQLIHWGNLSEWSATCLQRENDDTDRRRLVFNILRTLLPIENAPTFKAVQNLRIFGPYDLSTKQTDDLTQIEYDQILGHFQSSIDHYRQFLLTPSFGVAVPINPIVPPRVHARMIWRAQFERVSSLYSQSYSRLDFSRNVISDLLNVKGNFRGLTMGRRDIRHAIFSATWVAALNIAREWNRLLVDIQGLNAYHVSDQWLVSVDRWAHRLGCWKDHGYFPIGAITLKDASAQNYKICFPII